MTPVCVSGCVKTSTHCGQSLGSHLSKTPSLFQDCELYFPSSSLSIKMFCDSFFTQRYVLWVRRFFSWHTRTSIYLFLFLSFTLPSFSLCHLCLSFQFPSFSNDKNWRSLAASYRELHMVDDNWVAEKGHCVNTLAFIGPQRDEGPSSGPSTNLLLIDGPVAFGERGCKECSMCIKSSLIPWCFFKKLASC